MTQPDPTAPPVVMNATWSSGDRASIHADFTAPSGTTVFFGPSGSGKSLTLALIAGLLRPQSGTIHLHGSPVADPANNIHVRTQDRHLGMVFQDAALLPHRTALGNLTLALRHVPHHERHDQATAWLERVGAAHLAEQKPRTLSGGERQRIALARALAGQPRLLLLDEPFSALDRPTRHQLRDLLATLTREARTPTLLVTHDPDDVTALADHVLLFAPGHTRHLISAAEFEQTQPSTADVALSDGRCAQ